MEATYLGPSIDEWIKKMWYIYTMEYYSAVKKNNGFESIAVRWMNLEPHTQSEVSQKGKNKYPMESRKMALMNLKNGLVITVGKGEGGMN